MAAAGKTCGGELGLPGGKSGPTVKSTDPTATQRAANPGAGAGSNDQTASPTKNQDESKVLGLPGGKAGPATTKE